jgi:hypothetical protein
MSSIPPRSPWPAPAMALAAGGCLCLFACRPEPSAEVRAESPHRLEPPQTLHQAAEASSRATEPVASAPSAVAAVAAGSNSAPPAAAPSLSELATVPAGACIPPSRPASGPPRLRMSEDTSSPLPLVLIVLRRQVRGNVEACLAGGRQRMPGLQGRLVMRIELPLYGGVPRAVVEAGAGDEALHQCVANAFTSAPMPSLNRGGSLVLEPFVLTLCPDGSSSWPSWPGDGFH